jgi:sulfur carrier protein
MSIEIVVNGEAETCAALSVAALLQLRGSQADPQRRGVAVALNGALVPRSAWATTTLSPGDRIEIVRAAAGG